MKGFYSIWTGPTEKKNKEFFMQDFELLTMILSVLEWRKHNGPVKLVADDIALDFIRQKKLLGIFDDGYERLIVDEDIDAEVFWAAGKLFALKQMQEECAMVDLDLIVWKNLEEAMKASDIFVIHREDITEDIYPGKDYFTMADNYRYPEGFSWEAKPCNTALLYIKDIEFKNLYVDEAIKFMKACKVEKDNLKPMVFAEQRMLAGLAEGENKDISSAYPLAVDIGLQDVYTHVWGHKNILRFNYTERTQFCVKCLKRIKKEFPKYYKMIKDFEDFIEYIEY